MFVDFNILNQLGSPSINSNTFANRPSAGQVGRLFVSTDTFEIYRDTGTGWDLIGGPGSSTVTGSGAAGQVTYWTGTNSVGGENNLWWDAANNHLGINTSTPGAALDIHSTGVIAQLNTTSGTGNVNIAFQRNGTGVWRIGDTYNGGLNFFELHNTVLGNNALQVSAATNKTTWQATENYTSGIARGNYFDYNLTINPANPLASPNAITALGASLDLTLQGSVTIPSGARSGLDAYNSIGFTTTGTLTQNQGSQLRTYSNLTTGWAFNGTQTGTITHLSGIHVRFPDNTGSAMAITNNYGVLINDQTANTGTVTYTNRWGVYQEGASDLNYFAANTLIGTTVNAGYKLDVSGTVRFTDTLTGTIINLSSELTINRSTASSTYLIDLYNSNASNNAAYTTFRNAGVTMSVGVERSIGGAIINGGAYTGVITTVGTKDLNLATNEIIRLTLNGSTGAATFSSSVTAATDSNFTGTSVNTRILITASGVANTVLGFNNSGSTATGVSNNTGYVGVLQAYPLAFITDSVERMRITSGGNVLVGTTTDAGQKLQVNGSVTSTTITQTQTSATAILKQIGNSNAEGAAQKITIVRQYSVVSLGTKLIIPFTSQTNLNSTTICKVFGHGARYNSRGPLGFEITFAVGHLNLLDNLSSWNGNGNYASIAINGMSIEITFTADYTAATSDGVFVTIEYMTGTESYSIDVPNIAMN